jgi:uncharacterized membrane protein HdeD (DUF308 family)
MVLLARLAPIKEGFMSPNIGSTDRILRIVAGLILIALVFVGPRTAWGWIGILPLATGLFRFCPAYRAGPGCLNSFPRKISGVLPVLVCIWLPGVCRDAGRA